MIRIQQLLRLTGTPAALLFTLSCSGADGALQPGEKPCLTEKEHAAITQRHSEIGMLETEMGCDTLREFRKQVYLEKRTLHRRTVDGSLSNEDYASELQGITERENAHEKESKELKESCAIPSKERITLKREVLMRGRCAAYPVVITK
jgi:hypothetical protein|tara:strand:+ start:180 stop:623 length:444 start_codon:yes stop_codon:yes gene_type:complete